VTRPARPAVEPDDGDRPPSVPRPGPSGWGTGGRPATDPDAPGQPLVEEGGEGDDGPEDWPEPNEPG